MAAEIHPVSRSRHAALRWRRCDGYRFAAATGLAPIAAAELGQAALALTLAVVQREAHWGLAAVLGLAPGQNLYVDARGTWLAAYVPAVFRGYPFLIGAPPGGEPTLCVDEASGLVDAGAEGEPFFTEDGALSQGVAQVSGFLAETARSEAVLMTGCDVLHAAGLIEVWPIAVQGEAGTQTVTGLYRVSEAALNALPYDAFAGLRTSGVLGLAYAQILSMGNLGRLGQLAQARAQAEAAERARAEVKPMIMLPEDNTIDWDWSRIGKD